MDSSLNNEKYTTRKVVCFFVKLKNGDVWPVSAFGVFQWLLGPKNERGAYRESYHTCYCTRDTRVKLVRAYKS